jgi:hypothetical protein
MTDANRSTTPAAHAAHDLTTVAALAGRARDLDETTAAVARQQVASCSACADVLADLVALQTSLPTTSTPARPRDFRLTPADAARLQRTGWRRLVGFFGSPRDGFSRPLAIGFTTLGLAGLLVATVPSMFIAGSGGAATLSTVGNAVPQAAPAADEAYGTNRMSMERAPAGAGAGEPADGSVFSGANPDEIGRDITGDAGVFSIRDDVSGLSVLFVLGGIMLIAGLGLFGLRWSARRLL